MQALLTDPARSPWWLAAAFVAVLAAALWWPAPLPDERVVLAPAALRALANPAPPTPTAAIVVEADRTVAVPAPPAPPATATPAPAVQVEKLPWAEGDAPWDLAPPFRH
jgi:hypothetical protein